MNKKHGFVSRRHSLTEILLIWLETNNKQTRNRDHWSFKLSKLKNSKFGQFHFMPVS